MSTEKSIVICMGSSCFARGNKKNLALIEDFLETRNLSASIRLEGSHCASQCQSGPNIRIDGTLYQYVDTGMLLDILEKHFSVAAKE
ncbi:MAG: (2Fe-2S) ferredoxin domain-containing protein [Candidatus Hydrogenedens sp.]|jgi:NADH:ubiquinone oxidoreductase subunit E|nr:(2Fe-2S) ferredoxin domain-containing protein [Candidatus Hydrogenedens sp.]